MFWLPCHILGGWVYRRRQERIYGADVLRMHSLLRLRISTDDFGQSMISCCGGHHGILRCLFAIFCAPIRLAADSSAVGFIPFWIALILYSMFIPMLAVFGFVQRLHMRDEYHMHKNFIGDCLAWFCCFFMPLVQEGKFVDEKVSIISNEMAPSEEPSSVPLHV